MKLEKNIELLGYKEETEKWYSTADIFILTSDWEGFGNVIVEAMAYGLPIISTNCLYGPAEILENGDYGDLVECNDADGIVLAVLRNANRNKPITKNLNRAQDFSADKIAEEYLNFFESQ
jgi:glycosyltransferase involved in cell wall biosynthesis